jgi:hypothetical protein
MNFYATEELGKKHGTSMQLRIAIKIIDPNVIPNTAPGFN